ncbi:MAG: RHS repeat-associated core domain-containing protein, partial [bacterium]|nr:RHS repeat-associated core domain-containing protein [bacterium]
MLWIHSDHLHSATILTDAAGAELRRLAYRAFGEDAENVGSGNEPKYSYTGKERDATGLMYYGARYYDPALSRFISPDTLYDRGPQGLNHYSY